MHDMRIKLSAGLIVLALIHALAMVGGFYAIHEAPGLVKHNQATTPLPIPSSIDYGPASYGVLPQPAVTAPPVNRSALDEIKQQSPAAPVAGRAGLQGPASPLEQLKEGRWVTRNGQRVWCNDCGTSYVVPQPTYVQPTYVVPKSPAPTLAPNLPSSTPLILPPSSSILTNPQTLPAPKQYELALFVGTDARSQTLINWFNTDPDLQRVKAISNYQVYTKDDPLYRARYTSVVRPEHFPAIVFQHADGAHIHAAGGNFLPSTATQLFADLKQGVNYSKQVREVDRQMTGMIRTAGYSWDSRITPQMSLNYPSSGPLYTPLIGQTGYPLDAEMDCTDGYCKPRRPLDGLFDKGPTTALAWFSSGEMVAAIMAIAACLLIVVIVVKRM